MRIPNILVDLVTTEVGVPVLWWRSVGSTHTAYSTEVFIDEVAEAAGKDPLEFRRALLEGHARASAACSTSRPRRPAGARCRARGRFRGIAVHESFDTYVAQVAEISLRPDGRPKVERVVCAVDCGIAINPDIIRAQIEGGIGYGLGAILKGEITLEDGLVVQGNFDGYQVLTIDEMPQVEVHIVPSQESPTGIGEPGVPPIGPAVANAYYAATGKRIRILPFSRATTSRDRLTPRRLVAVCSPAARLAGIARPRRGGRPRRRRRPSPGSPTRRPARWPCSARPARCCTHPRCVNCHPAGDRPLQGEDGHLHIPAVQRGDGGIGVAGLRCTTCHQTGQLRRRPACPGNPQWHLAPIEMAWQGKSLAEICSQIKDPARNGGKSMAELVEHMAEDSLVGWGWAPGHGPGARARHAGGVRRADRRLGRDRGALPARLRPGGRPAHNSEPPLCA